MKQFLLDRFKFFGRKKNTQTIFIEDLEDGVDGIAHVLEIEVDLSAYQKNTLMEKKALFDRIENKLHRRIANKIVDAIERPEKYFGKKKTRFIADIARRCRVSTASVHSTIGAMRGLLTQAAG